jgi:hypothetical protein
MSINTPRIIVHGLPFFSPAAAFRARLYVRLIPFFLFIAGIVSAVLCVWFAIGFIAGGPDAHLWWASLLALASVFCFLTTNR